MKKLIAAFALLFTSFAVAQLPDAPLPQPKTTVDFSTVVHNAPSTLKPEGRGKREPLVFAGALAFAIGTDVYDVRASERAFKLGYVETNTFLVCREVRADQVSTCRPGASTLYTRDAIELGVATLPSVLGYVFHRPEFFYAGLAAPAVIGIKHIQGGYRASHLKGNTQ